jgi:hypothetical protein
VGEREGQDSEVNACAFMKRKRKRKSALFRKSER